MKQKIYFIFFLLVFLGCKKDKDDTPPLPENVEILTFQIDGIEFTIEDGIIIGNNPEEIANKNELVASFLAEGTVTVNGIEQESNVTLNDFSGPITYTVTGPLGTTKEYKVKYITFTGLPRLYITTENRTRITKEVYERASFRLDANHQFETDVIEEDGRIKGRGNTTWRYAKKPYKLKFDSKTSLLNMPAHKTWVLLANYVDKTLIRNYLAYSLADKLDTSFPPSYHLVEVFLNGVHQGNYMLTDQIEVSSNRVDIPELKPTDNDDFSITGGYLLEIDQRILQAQDETYFESNHFPIVIKSPDEPSDLQIQYISNYVKEAEEALFGENFMDPNNGFRKYFDEESMIKWFIVSEVFKNVDSRQFSSIYFHKDRSGKLTMGPIWDFDLGAGNASHCRDCMKATGWHVMNNPWFKRMYEDPAFKTKVKNIWKQYKTDIDELLPQINSLRIYLDLSQKRNFTLWPRFDEPEATVQNLPDYDSHMDYLYGFLRDRINWMDSELK